MSFRKRMLRHGPRKAVLAASVGALVATGGLASTAWAQEDDEAADDDTSDEDIIIVTGTRIRRDDFSAPNATTVVTSDDMRALGVFSVAEMVQQLPANVGSTQPETRPDSTFNLGASIANLRGLNLNTGSRTLTLVNSRRFVGSNSTGAVDMNMIPSALVGRIETVTGGASATYGADAMAGVVNVILDNSIEGIRVDLSMNQTDRGGGDDYNFSLGTGFELFDQRGQLTIGYDHSDQESIDDCTQAREICRVSRRLFQNGSPGGGFFPNEYDPLVDKFFPELPQYVLGEGFRYARTPQGWMSNLGSTTDPGCAATNYEAGPNCDLSVGSYTFSDDGLTIIPIYDELTQAQRDVMADAGEGPLGTTPFGQGALAYKGVPIIPETIRDNLYTSFNYDFEGGTSIRAELTYGKTESRATQASARQSWWGWDTIFLDNAFLSPQHGASQALRDLFFARRAVADPPGPFGPPPPFEGCDPAPYLGDGTLDNPVFPLDQGAEGSCNEGSGNGINKDISDIVHRFNITDTETINFTLGGSGELFEGGSWTWDAYIQFGESERFVEVKNWEASRRTDMAMNSVWDLNLDRAVCRIDSTNPSPVPGFATEGEWFTDKWITYIETAMQVAGEDISQAQAAFDQLSGRNGLTNPCAPFNPFGHYTASLDAINFAFPSIVDGTRNDQTSASISFSGDIWDGYGAGPWRMAAGVDVRRNKTDNGPPGGSGFSSRDFGLNFDDDWNGETDTDEAFVEFEMPLLRDMPGADYLMINTAYRYTENTTRRLSGGVGLNNTTDSRNTESWKASMVWQPLDVMRVRLTRSQDTRAPSGTELFEANRGSLSFGTTGDSAFRYDNPLTPSDEQEDEWIDYMGGGNPQLDVETSLTQTLGLVFEPSETVPGLQVSVDYYETNIIGGIQTVTGMQTQQRCRGELELNNYVLSPDMQYCGNVVFDPGGARAGVDDFLMLDEDGNPNGLYPNFVRLQSVTSSSENADPFLSRGIDVSVNYDTQLSGGGLISGRILVTRALEQRVTTGDAIVGSEQGETIDVSGQTGSQGIASIWQWASAGFTDYAPTPRISGNLWLTYSKNAFSVTSQVRYIGSGRLNNQAAWIGPNECKSVTVDPFPPGGGDSFPRTACYDPDISLTVSDPDLPSYATLNLNFNYDFSRSRFQLNRFESLNAYLNIENVGDRMPDFFSGTGAGGVNTVFFSLMGRQYRAGVRMEF